MDQTLRVSMPSLLTRLRLNPRPGTTPFPPRRLALASLPNTSYQWNPHPTQHPPLTPSVITTGISSGTLALPSWSSQDRGRKPPAWEGQAKITNACTWIMEIFFFWGWAWACDGCDGRTFMRMRDASHDLLSYHLVPDRRCLGRCRPER